MPVQTIIASTHILDASSQSTFEGALAISDDQIAAIGSLDEMKAFAAEENTGSTPAEIRDFGDAFVSPGFHDSHVHFFHSSVYSSNLAASFLGKNELDCVERMKELAKKRPHGWLLSQGWREYRWDDPRVPSKHSLDAVFPNRPVALYSGDAHTLWLNSCALKTLGISNNSKAPEGGSYDRDEHGELTGIAREAAAMELMPKIMGAFTNEEFAEAYRGFFKRLGQNGITSVCDLSLMALPGLDFIRDDVHEMLLERGQLTSRVNMFPTLLADTSRFERMYEHFRGPLLSCNGLKQFFDGVSSQHTAWLNKPYTNARFEGDCGRPTIDPEDMHALIMNAASHGWPVRVHAIGDEAIHVLLDFFEEARKTYGPLPHGLHNGMEHLENFQPEDMHRLAELDISANVQPGHITLDPGGPERDLGMKRVPYMWPFKTLADLGTHVSFGTDSPVVDVNSMGVLYTAVTRKDQYSHEPLGGWLPEERLSMSQAIRNYTYGSAYACSREKEVGSLAVGMKADIAVCDHNLLEAEDEEILDTKVLATFTGGRLIFER